MSTTDDINALLGITPSEIVKQTKVVKNELALPNANHLEEKIISETNDELFYFDLTQGLMEGEYPVYEYYTKTRYADSFLEFLKRRILEI